MTCKDCVHYEDCLTDERTQYYSTTVDCDVVENNCNFFINKADFVEVVRCKDCDYREPIDERISYKRKHPMHCILKSALTADDDYCKYGRRKDNGVL